MNFCWFLYESFSVPKHFSYQSHHLNYPWKTNYLIYFHFFKKQRIKLKFWFLFKLNFEIQMQLLNFVFFSIVKMNFSICIKVIFKHNIYFRLRLFFSSNSCRGLRKVFWIEKDIVSCFQFVDLFIQEQCIRGKWKKCVTFYLRKKLMKKYVQYYRQDILT